MFLYNLSIHLAHFELQLPLQILVSSQSSCVICFDMNSLCGLMYPIPPNKHTVCKTFKFVLPSPEKSVDPDQLVSNSVS